MSSNRAVTGCHSWIYQPTVANRLLTAFELAKTLALKPAVGAAALRRALAVPASIIGSR